MTSDGGLDRPFTVALEETGLLRLSWATGVHITEPAARAAMAEVDRLCAGGRHPMLVDMSATAAVSRQARSVFAEPCSAGIIALLGKSPVDRVIANFVLGVSTLPCPTRFFTSEPDALGWLRDGWPDG